MPAGLAEFAQRHVCHDVRMLVGSHRLLSRATDTVTHDAALESFLLHARSLDAFLTGADRSAGDVVAADYDPGWTAEAVMPVHARELTDTVALLAQAHERPLQVAAVLDAVGTTVERFVAGLPPTSRAWFAEATALLADPPLRNLVATSETSEDQDWDLLMRPEG